jgi:hypothetical protein
MRKDRTMRNIVTRICIGAAITAIGLFGADLSIGTWKLNVAKSTTTDKNPYVSMTDVRQATPDGGVKLTRTGQRKDGTVVNGSYVCKYDGKECPATGLGYDTISIKRVDEYTTTFEARKKGGSYHTTGKTVTSKDGKTRTQTSTGVGADGAPLNQTLVYEKQ